MQQKPSTINVELTEQEAKLFMVFRQHQDNFKTMVDAGVFNVRNGQASLFFDGSGSLMEIDYNLVGYKKGKPIIHVVAITS